VHCVGFSSGSVFCLSKTNRVTRMAINPGIPTPSAMPRVSLEGPVNGAKDGEAEGVAVCDSVKFAIAGTDAEGFVEPKIGVDVAVESKVGIDVAEDDPLVILKVADLSKTPYPFSMK
jgi:hypothetical protein